MLEENYCFDAEMYADEIEVDEALDFREDQRSEFWKEAMPHFQFAGHVFLSIYVGANQSVPSSQSWEMGLAVSFCEPD